MKLHELIVALQPHLSRLIVIRALVLALGLEGDRREQRADDEEEGGHDEEDDVAVGGDGAAAAVEGAVLLLPDVRRDLATDD